GPLLASGRDGDVFEYGPDLVVRKARDGRSLEGEARIMEHVASRGFPVPAIHDVRAAGSEIVMDRISGGSMVHRLERRPWTMAREARVLAELHKQLHTIPAPDWLPRHPDGGDRVVHRDLHPLNVLYGTNGPVVIDWPNAVAGTEETDVAHTWLLIEGADTSDQPFLARAFAPILKVPLARFVVREFDRAAVVARLGDVAAERDQDRNVRPNERRAVQRIVAREEARLR
ncbi:MAG TPA: phosphotransferase, partial [Acidimicrobiia bacterium]